LLSGDAVEACRRRRAGNGSRRPRAARQHALGAQALVDPGVVVAAAGDRRERGRLVGGAAARGGGDRLALAGRDEHHAVVVADHDLTRLDDIAVDADRNVDLARPILVRAPVRHAP
jgi:hypothetical protein